MNRARNGSGGSDPPPVGEAIRVDLHRDSYDSEVSDGLEQSSAQRGLRLRFIPIRRGNMCGVPLEKL